jgi:hypothetical protein
MRLGSVFHHAVLSFESDGRSLSYKERRKELTILSEYPLTVKF